MAIPCLSWVERKRVAIIKPNSIGPPNTHMPWGRGTHANTQAGAHTLATNVSTVQAAKLAMTIDNGQKLLRSYLKAGNNRMLFASPDLRVYCHIYFIARVVERKWKLFYAVTPKSMQCAFLRAMPNSNGSWHAKSLNKCLMKCTICMTHPLTCLPPPCFPPLPLELNVNKTFPLPLIFIWNTHRIAAGQTSCAARNSNSNSISYTLNN